MPELIVLVLDSSDQIPGVLDAWLAAGVSGVTSIDSSGLGHHVAEHGLGGDLPLIPSLAQLLRPREDPSRTLFTVVPDGFDVDGLIAATEAVTGSLDAPDTGILFVLPVTRVRGLQRRRSTGG
jgi:nitrogen regulatory protein P-II 1